MEKYMSLPECFLPGVAVQSFEEVRIADYLKAYTSTGRPPVPFVGTSTFQPHIPPSESAVPLSASTSFGSVVSPASATSPAPLPGPIPTAQSFASFRADGEVYQSITADPSYRGHSFEELRVQAYLAGNKTPPSTVTMSPFTLDSTKRPGTTSLNTSASASSDTSGEQLQSITAKPEYSRHSFEELRIAYMQAGREMTSDEISPPSASGVVSFAPPSTPQPPPLITASTTPRVPPAINTPFAPSPLSKPFSFSFS